MTEYDDVNFSSEIDSTKKGAATAPGTESTAINIDGAGTIDESLLAMESDLPGTTTSSTYTYGGTGYANPDAVTQMASGLSMH